MEKKIYYFIVLLLLQYGQFFAQQNTNSTFNSSFWNAYADKIHLDGKEREEFISSHQKQNSPAPISLIQVTSQPVQAAPNPSNNIFAGPCVNADFEMGNMTGWVPTTGYNPGFNAFGCCPTAGGAQLVTAGAGLDPFGGFPVVCPGGSFSLRLGNSGTGGIADRIEQTFLVSPANSNFSYKYAVVLQDPGHIPSQQPSFQVEMLDTNNVLVPCTHFYVAAGQGIPGFSNSPTPGVIYKPWTTVLIDLGPYIGQNLTIRFTTYDCALGGHFGYAYIDGVCQAFTGGGSATVCAGGTQTFCAPSGLASYTWNGPGVSNSVGLCVNAAAPGVYTVQTTLFTNCPGPSFTYTLFNQGIPVANAGPNATVCANNSTVSLAGSITGFSSTPQWTSSGSGVFTPSTNLTTSYTPSGADVSAGSVTLSLTTANNGLCPASTSSMIVTILPSPSVNAGTDQTICANSTAALSGTVTGPTNLGTWTSSGNGLFSPSPNILNPSYFPSAADLAAGSVTLTLTSTNNQACLAVNDNLILHFQNQAVAVAGSNQTVCANNSTVALLGVINGYSATPQWSSSGSGVFTSTSNLSTTYTPSASDISAGFVNFTLTTANNGVCAPSTSTLQITITPAPVVNAGASQTICSNGTAVLNGTVTGPTSSGSWSSAGGGTFNPSPNILNPNYFPSASEISAGNATLVLTSTGNGNCMAVTNSVVISIVKLATLTTIPSQSVCSAASSINLSANISGGTNTGLWTTDGTGAFNPGPASLNNTYNITPADVSAGMITFTLTSTNNGPCPAVTNTLTLSMFPLAIVNAGPNQIVCSSGGTIGLNATSTNMGSWSGNGSGSFIPNNNFLNATYSLSAADILAGSVTFTFSSANNGACPVVQDTVRMSIKTIATVNAGANQVICSSSGAVNLTGIVGGGVNTGIWSTNGTGAFNPANNFLNNTYLISTGDISAGSIIFTLTSSNNNPCPAVTDTVMLTIYKLATVNTGPDQLICSNAGTVSLSGSVNSSSNTGIWSCTGTGSFYPDNLSLTPVYTITASDINTGFVSFTLSSTNNGPCALVTDSVRINIRKLNTVNAGPDIQACSTSPSIAISGTITGGSTTGIWSTNGTGNFSPANILLSTFYNITAQDLNSGNVKLILTSSNNGVCPAVKDSLNIKIFKNPSITSTADTSVCVYQNPLKLHPNVTGDYGFLQWNSNGFGWFLPTNQSIPVTYDFTKDILTGAVSHVTLSISALNNGPCGNISSNIRVTIHPAPIADFSPSSYTADIPNDPITFSNQSKNANNYYWDFGDGSYSSQISPVHNYRNVGDFHVLLISTNLYGCSDTATKDIHVISDIQFPNVFTPNLNGANGGSYDVNNYSNDVFFPYTSGVTEYNLKIFNRWGELIFESSDLMVGWDGYFKGKLCQQDAYVWKADVKFFDGRKYNKTGSVTLLR